MLLIHANEENATLVTRTIADACRCEIALPVCAARPDFEHMEGLRWSEADFRLHYVLSSTG